MDEQKRHQAADSVFMLQLFHALLPIGGRPIVGASHFRTVPVACRAASNYKVHPLNKRLCTTYFDGLTHRSP